MSSDYHVICVSHDPALVLWDREFTNPPEVIAAAADPAKYELTGHDDCDLLVGRVSGDWVEFACPGGERCKPGFHTAAHDTWTDIGWLRLIHHAYTTGVDVSAFRIPFCWTKVRVLHLGRQLGMPAS